MPALGGLTISARWPLPSGLTRFTSRWLRFFGSDSRLISSIGWIGVRSWKTGRRRAVSKSTPLTLSTRIRPQYFSPSRGRADGAGDPVADPQAVAADLAGADVDVLRARQEAVAAHEAVALVDDVEDAEGEVEARALGLRLEDLADQVVLAAARASSMSSCVADLRSSLRLISRRSRMSRSLRSRAASSSATSSCSVTGRRDGSGIDGAAGDCGRGAGRGRSAWGWADLGGTVAPPVRARRRRTTWVAPRTVARAELECRRAAGGDAWSNIGRMCDPSMESAAVRNVSATARSAAVTGPIATTATTPIGGRHRVAAEAVRGHGAGAAAAGRRGRSRPRTGARRDRPRAGRDG